MSLPREIRVEIIWHFGGDRVRKRTVTGCDRDSGGNRVGMGTTTVGMEWDGDEIEGMETK